MFVLIASAVSEPRRQKWSIRHRCTPPQASRV